ncbi:Copper amine oxidase N-terminal domain-containing protein [Paenibacillus polysaccharolyticus]|uniref:Copper amine oxidase N-terminal domain-containing protein n=1 Tax=Paenibacillus polysaccharolyticus TaxID=582692 RepID=A0A1G5ASX7_9BACL|nr:NPCBM/NEW2 domain-containing protein [Paenibacillus polysaccharolyticus]SCX80983.1 Copper amine oxidase N-terminal domain-containing protein [Paenibacillus polysaccharolyticus]
MKTNKLTKLKYLCSGIILGSVLFTGVSYAATTANIGVNFLPLKFFVDGVEKRMPEGQQGFVYKGTTYVPLRFVSESLGKSVGYDAPSYSVYVGKPKEGTITYLEQMKPHASDNKGSKAVETFTTNLGTQFNHGIYLTGSAFGGNDSTGYGYGKGNYLVSTYLLDGNYKTFEALLAPSSKWNTLAKNDNLGSLKIYADDKLVYTSGAVASDLKAPININVDLTGVLNLKVEFKQNQEDSELGLLEAKFIQ